MRSTAHRPSNGKVDIHAFVDRAREFNRQARQIVTAQPLDGKRSKPLLQLEGVLDELETTVRALRAVVEGHWSSSGRTKLATKHAGAPAPLVLGTTEAMIKNGHLVTPVEFQNLMGWTTRQAVWKAAESQRVFYLDHKAERYFPAFYGDAAYDRKHLAGVTKALGDLPGGSKLQFFLTHKGSLGGATPLQALASGRFAKVKDVAAAFAEASRRDVAGFANSSNRVA